MNNYIRQIFIATINTILFSKIEDIKRIDLTFFTPGVLKLTLILTSIITILLIIILISSLRLRKIKKTLEIKNEKAYEKNSFKKIESQKNKTSKKYRKRKDIIY